MYFLNLVFMCIENTEWMLLITYAGICVFNHVLDTQQGSKMSMLQ